MQEYRNIITQVKNLTRHQHGTHLSNIFPNSDNRKPFWRYLKSRKQDTIGIGTLKTLDGNTVTDPYNKAELLNSHFESVFTSEDPDRIPDKGPSPCTTITDIEITTQGCCETVIFPNPLDQMVCMDIFLRLLQLKVHQF